MKYITLRLILCVTLCVVAVAGCRHERGGSGSSVVARIGDEEITREDLQAAMDYRMIPEARREDLQGKILEVLIDESVFAGEAKRLGLDKDPETRANLDRVRNETLARWFSKKYVDKQAEPSEEELKEFFQEHKAQAVIPASVFIQEIVVKDEKVAPELLRQLKDGASFEELAKKKSIARSWEKGGLAGWQYKGKMDPALEKVAFDLERKKLSDIIKTKKGYQIVKVLDKKDRKELTFDEARADIRQRLLRDKKRGVIHEYYKNAKVNRNPGEKGVLASVRDEKITEEDLAGILATVPEKDKERVRKRWVHYLIELKVFSEEARKVDLEKDPEVARALRQKAHHTLAKAFRKQVLKHKFQISEQEMEDYYQSNLEDFRRPVRVRVKAIRVKTEEEAENIVKQLKAGAYFTELAMEKSLYPGASRNVGEIGWFAMGERDPALEKVAFALEKGQGSDMIKTAEGYEIIKLMDKKGGKIKPFDEIKQEIKMMLMAQKMDKEKALYYKNAGVKILVVQPSVTGQ